ncbi:MAG TPA: hypothetical protein PK264_20935, partial [Hyphomicrobiaceae bacterium]|nr:hypothetical protein [Hyphomicrobiaceae bacterium]
ADANRDGAVSARELTDFVTRRIDQRLTHLFPAERRHQTPTLLGDAASRLAMITPATPKRDQDAEARLLA